jgi:hypothetical protein
MLQLLAAQLISNTAGSIIDNVVRDRVGKPAIGSVVYCDLAFGIAEHSGGKLDKTMKSTLPPIERTRLIARPRKLASMPPAFKALMRYDAAGLLEDLIPVSPRAAKLKKAYLAWLS